MSSIGSIFGKSMIMVALVLGFLAVTGTASAQNQCPDAASCAAIGQGWSNLGVAIGAGLAIGLAGLATGLAQKDIGAAAIGAVAENPANLGRAIVFVAIPETIVIFGLLIAFQLAGGLAVIGG